MYVKKIPCSFLLIFPLGLIARFIQHASLFRSQSIFFNPFNDDTLLSEDGIKTLNAYALKGYRLITDYPLFDKPTSREEFLDAFNVAMQFYEKKDS